MESHQRVQSLHSLEWCYCHSVVMMQHCYGRRILSLSFTTITQVNKVAQY